MAYTTIDDGSAHFHTQTYTGNGSADRDITNDANAGDFQPDWLWIKSRSLSGNNHHLFNSNVGMPNHLSSDLNDGEQTATNKATAFNTNGFRVQTHSSVNQSSATYVAWQWKAGGIAPTKTYKVVVVSDGGNKYRFRNSGDTATFAQSAVTLDLQEGGTYTFDLSDSSVDGHPMKFSETSNGSHGGGSVYSTGVVYQLDGSSVSESNYYNTSNFNSASSRKIIITVASSAPTLYYYCHYHSGMGGQVNTNSTHGQTNFDGDILSVSQENTTAGFSIVTYTGNGNGSDQTIGHGLGAECKVVFAKMRTDAGDSWRVFHEDVSQSGGGNLFLNGTSPLDTGDPARIKSTNTSTFTLLAYSSGYNAVNGSGKDYIAFCFSEIKGYSKIGSFKGNGNVDGTFVYTGFKPAWIMLKRTDSTNNWNIFDSKRDVDNQVGNVLYANLTNAEEADASHSSANDFLSNGFKLRETGNAVNGSGASYIYLAFAEHPFVSSKGVPTTAR